MKKKKKTKEINRERWTKKQGKQTNKHIKKFQVQEQ
jgi:hypothetical protein